MRNSRTGIVAVLLAVEVFIGGAILWAFTGGHAWPAQGAGFRHISEEGKTFAPIDAGSAPHVVIDDPDSRIVITRSADGKVHVTDAWRTAGWIFNEAAKAVPLLVQRTAEGVTVRRSAEHFHVGFFTVDSHRTEVALPAGAAIEVQRCSGADVSGIDATELKIASSDGGLRLEDVATPSIDAGTDDGSIEATNLRVGSGALHTNDGSIRVGLAGANLTVHAQTGEGSIRFNGNRVHDGDPGTADYQVGTGGGSLRISTQDGSIHISTNGAR